MVLFPSSIFLWILGKLFQQVPPDDINHFWGFRTKKSKKNKENWMLAQKEYGEQSTKVFMYTVFASFFWLLADIVFLFLDNDTFMIVSVLLQSIVLLGLLLMLYLNVNNKLE
ncbi:SdpI family protein [Staphylococcus simulans]|uniref:SdpI family protein n=1 Tax=Staphylococcus simulans TaxID=1286 RepID=UPI000E683238|nr:SdpI family protein [Staphylococcus simulans]RIN78926.1 SdpI family protein [Staphylococcus simulans]